jgi:hypothetical protein
MPLVNTDAVAGFVRGQSDVLAVVLCSIIDRDGIAD